MKPHGDGTVARKYKIDVTMKTGGRSAINIPEDTISYDSYGLKVFRGGSQVIDKLEERGINNRFCESFFEFVANFGKSHIKNVGESRDYGTGTRINVGSTQGQVNSIFYDGDNNLKIPLLKGEGSLFLSGMEPDMRFLVGKLLEHFRLWLYLNIQDQ